jgi:hypothetical protein
MTGGTYNLGYTTLPTFPTNSIGYLDASANYVTTTLSDNATTYIYFIGTASTSLFLNVGAYIFTFSGFLINNTSTLAGNFYLLLTLGETNSGYNGGNLICETISYANNNPQGAQSLTCCHIFYVTSKQYFNFTGLYALSFSTLSTTTLTYSYALCRIA